MTGLDAVSVIVPCRNEARFVRECLESLLANEYRDGAVEFLIIDGISTDGTRAILDEFASRDARIRVLDNRRLTAPFALNIGLRESKGAVVMRADAHAVYPRDYIARCVGLLRAHGAANAGGRVVAAPTSHDVWSRALARVVSSRAGVGESRFRVGGAAGDADTVPFGTFPRELFEELGGFDERLTRAQDSAFNARIRAAGKRIVFDPDIVVTYRGRDTARGLMRQAFLTGQWMVYAARLYPSALRWRRLVPAFFVIYLGGLVIALGSAWGPARLLLAPLAAYLILISASAISGARGPIDWACCVVAFAGFHLSYGLGTLLGVARLVTGGWTRRLGAPLNR